MSELYKCPICRVGMRIVSRFGGGHVYMCHNDACEVVGQEIGTTMLEALNRRAPSAERHTLEGDRHPESYCHKCGGPNIVWFVANPLWNKYVPDDGIICPVCFVQIAESCGLECIAWELVHRTQPQIEQPQGEPAAEGLKSIDPALLEPFKKEMQEKTIPAIVDAVRQRQRNAAEDRGVLGQAAEQQQEPALTISVLQFSDSGHTEIAYRPARPFSEWDEGEYQLYTHQQPRHTRDRWNIEQDGDDLLICFNDHEKHEGCEYVRYVPASQHQQPQMQGEPDEFAEIEALAAQIAGMLPSQQMAHAAATLRKKITDVRWRRLFGQPRPAVPDAKLYRDMLLWLYDQQMKALVKPIMEFDEWLWKIGNEMTAAPAQPGYADAPNDVRVRTGNFAFSAESRECGIYSDGGELLAKSVLSEKAHAALLSTVDVCTLAQPGEGE